MAAPRRVGRDGAAARGATSATVAPVQKFLDTRRDRPGLHEAGPDEHGEVQERRAVGQVRDLHLQAPRLSTATWLPVRGPGRRHAAGAPADGSSTSRRPGLDLADGRGQKTWGLQVQVTNLTNRTALYNFQSVFVGTRLVQPRTVSIKGVQELLNRCYGSARRAARGGAVLPTRRGAAMKTFLDAAWLHPHCDRGIPGALFALTDIRASLLPPRPREAWHRVEMRIARQHGQAMLERQRCDPDIVGWNGSALPLEREPDAGVDDRRFSADGEDVEVGQVLVEPCLVGCVTPGAREACT